MNNLFGNEETKPDEEKAEVPKKRERRRKKTKPEEPKSFEDAIDELEKLVERLEDPETPLEESVKIFERAQFLAKWCMNILEKIEGKLKLLVPTEEGFELEDFEEQ